MRNWALLFVVLLATALPISAQAVEREFVWGRDYTFERMEATRVVDDKQDKGTIRLVAYVYRPVRNDRHEVVLFSHGSTGGMVRSPKEAMDAPPPPVISFFVSRGYTLVAPMRRGRNESSGTYIEECSVYMGECTPAEQTTLGDRALREALLDTNAAIDQIVNRLIPRDSRIIAAGISRGGFLSLMLAGERPKLIKAVVNFVGGWQSVTERLSPSDAQQRMDDHKTRLQRAAKSASSSSIWLYAARDPFYKEGIPQELHRYWTDAGGKGDLVYISDHALASGHMVASNAALWGKQVDAFLKTLGEK